jgi:hypothetical protein
VRSTQPCARCGEIRRLSSAGRCHPCEQILPRILAAESRDALRPLDDLVRQRARREWATREIERLQKLLDADTNDRHSDQSRPA